MVNNIAYTAITVILLYLLITAFALYQALFEGRTGSWEVWGMPLRWILG